MNCLTLCMEVFHERLWSSNENLCQNSLTNIAVGPEANGQLFLILAPGSIWNLITQHVFHNFKTYAREKDVKIVHLFERHCKQGNLDKFWNK